MTSERRLRANRSNAKASTGPRTSAGKAQSARNAFRHGLSLPLTFDSALGRQVEELARRIAGETPDPVRFRLAQQIAEAQSQLQRVRARRLDLIASALADPSYKPLAMVRQQAAAGIAVLSGMGMTLGELEEVDRTLKMRPLEGPEKLAAILGDLARELARLHRYADRRGSAGLSLASGLIICP